MDTVTPSTRSRIMRQVKSKETKLETHFRSLLWRHGLRYRKNNSKLYGKPDLSFKAKKLVVFIDSCFWHGCALHLRMPASNLSYWQSKIDRNVKRDQEVNKHYLAKGWFIVRVWEHDLKDEKSAQSIINRVVSI